MNNLTLILSAILIILSSCDSTGQNEKNTSSTKVQEGRVDLAVTEFKQKMSEENVVILDVRTPRETNDGMIAGAIEINVNSPDFQEKIKELDKDKTYLVYCRSGRRSVAACDIMEREGFKKLYNLLGGYLDYSKNSN